MQALERNNAVAYVVAYFQTITNTAKDTRRRTFYCFLELLFGNLVCVPENNS